MKKKIIALTLALCLMAGSLIACLNFNKKSTERMKAINEAAIKNAEMIDGTVDPSSAPCEEESVFD